MTKPPILPNALDELIRWLSQQSQPCDANVPSDAARMTTRRAIKRRVLHHLKREFDVDPRLFSVT